MIIGFLLPQDSSSPVGGYKIVYEYANLLSRDGYDVKIIYGLHFSYREKSLAQKIWCLLRFLKHRNDPFRSKQWFHLLPAVQESRSLTLSESFVPTCDVYVATTVATSFYLAQYKRRTIKKLYLIQGYETWIRDEETVMASYHLPLKKIVISKWLQDKVNGVGEEAKLIFNGFDFSYFTLTKPISERSPYSVCMMYHVSPLKGSSDGVCAIKMLKEKYPDLLVRMFGSETRPNGLPSYIEYYQRPSKDRHNMIYNNSSIYIGTSYSEGFGLTIGEAMICGCAVVCTDISGYLEMVKPGISGLVVPIHSPEKIAATIEILFNDNDLRIMLAENGNKSIQNFSWKNAIGEFESLIQE